MKRAILVAGLAGLLATGFSDSQAKKTLSCTYEPSSQEEFDAMRKKVALITSNNDSYESFLEAKSDYFDSAQVLLDRADQLKNEIKIYASMSKEAIKINELDISKKLAKKAICKKVEQLDLIKEGLARTQNIANSDYRFSMSGAFVILYSGMTSASNALNLEALLGNEAYRDHSFMSSDEIGLVQLYELAGEKKLARKSCKEALSILREMSDGTRRIGLVEVGLKVSKKYGFEEEASYFQSRQEQLIAKK